ncbi:hypothetical protein BGX33_004560 [Mortierella sp. NVP41]|nr:hypothetical protein BGX33_004560 [Mortierella sp. NVP41]
MGVIDIACLASNPESTKLYGLSYNRALPSENGRLILFQSQSNPSTIDDVRWTVASTLPGNIFRPDMVYHNFVSFSCATDSAGVFSAIGYYGNRTSENTGGSLIPSVESPLEGIRYDPRGRMASEFNIGGNGGTWSTIEVEPNYNRTATPDYKDQKLFYVKERDTETLMHAYIDTDGMIRIGRVEENMRMPTLKYSTSFQESQRSDLGLLATIDNTLMDSRIRPIVNITENYAQHPLMNNLVPMSGGLVGGNPYAVLMSTTHVGAIDIAGTTPGHIRFGAAVSVAGNYGFGGSNEVSGNKTPSWNYGSNGGWEEGTESPTVIALICAGVAMVLFYGWYFIRKRRQDREERRAAKARNNNSTNSSNIQHDDNDLATIELGIRTTAGNHGQEPPFSAYSTSSLPAYTYQESVQPTGLSSHPRPSIVTTIEDSTS